MVRELTAKGAKIDLQRNDRTHALLVASRNGHIEVVRELIAKGAKIDLQIDDGMSALLGDRSEPHTGVFNEISRDIYTLSVCRMSVVCQINCVGGITYGPRACSKSFVGD